MSGSPFFAFDAKAFAEEVAEVLGASFPAPPRNATWAVQARADGLTYTERLERVAFMVAGEQRRVLAETVALAREDEARYPDPEQAEWSVHADVAALLQLAPGTAESRIGDARTLAERLPLTLERLRAGELSVSKAYVMLAETANLDAPEAVRVDEGAMRNMRGSRSQFRDRVRRLIARIDPAAVIGRRKKARKDEVGVVTLEAEDGLNAINALIPAEDAGRAWTAICERAKELKLPGDTRSVTELRAAAFVDLLVNRPDGTPRVTWQVQVIVPVGTLLGLSDADAHIPGHGAVPAEVARDIAEQAGDCQRLLIRPDTGELADATITRYRPRFTKRRRVLRPDERATDTRVQIPGFGPIPTDVADLIASDPEWQRLLTDPDTAERLDANPDRYRPGIALDRFIRLRDQHCRWPGCRRPAHQTDVDHTIPHGRTGGLTIRRNLACFCRRHHQIKQLPGWHVDQGEHGELTFTTPTGGIYRTRPPNPDGAEEPA
jgi:hypothetical protein